ncbi:DUF202 domain-containing protein [Marinobacter sp. ELB17]|uniref:DUF202 domain-containing protein n=1 Tax=Marinobacter sp. ELB17 TaxID=270374 RepID=UPI0000F3616C|nr:hypothetical protein MELB17_23917 [Marinobacter sp. ELB17]
MRADDKAIRTLSAHMRTALAISVAGTVLAALFGLTNSEGPTVISLLILAGAITATGIVIFRGIARSKKIARGERRI